MEEFVIVGVRDLPPCNRCMFTAMGQPSDLCNRLQREVLLELGIPEECKNLHCLRVHSKEVELEIFRYGMPFTRLKQDQSKQVYEWFIEHIWRPWHISRDSDKLSKWEWEWQKFRVQMECPNDDYQMYCELETDERAEWICYSCGTRIVEYKRVAPNTTELASIDHLNEHNHTQGRIYGRFNRFPPVPAFKASQKVELFPPRFPHCGYKNVSTVQGIRWIEDHKQGRYHWEYKLWFYNGTDTDPYWIPGGSLRLYGDVDIGDLKITI